MRGLFRTPGISPGKIINEIRDRCGAPEFLHFESIKKTITDAGLELVEGTHH